LDVRPPLCVVFEDIDKLVLARRVRAELVRPILFFRAVALHLVHLNHPLECAELALTLGHEVAILTHGPIEVISRANTLVKFFLTYHI
jgi:hypothetical protein